jgi:O-antigen ligase
LLFFVAIFSSYLNKYSWQKVFLDANAYIFIFYLPVWYQVYRPEYLASIINILKAAAIVVAVKTIFIFNLFVQNYEFLDLTKIYKWIRDTRTGEITPFANNFTRVFFQSHFYLLVAWFAVILEQISNFKNKNNFLFISLISSALLISLSRSLWLGGALALVLLLIYIFFSQRKIFWPFIASCLLVLVTSILTIEIFYNLPHYNSYNILYSRAATTGEAATNSRLELLDPMLEAIKEKPILGWGFGKELSYRSSDPRIKNDLNPEGWYTTYSFEWGWLDMWLKSGFFMMAAFLLWLSLIFSRGYNVLKRGESISLFLLPSIIAMFFIHIFSPYINHPLGLGLLMLSTIIFNANGKKDQSYN